MTVTLRSLTKTKLPKACSNLSAAVTSITSVAFLILLFFKLMIDGDEKNEEEKLPFVVQHHMKNNVFMCNRCKHSADCSDIICKGRLKHGGEMIRL